MMLVLDSGVSPRTICLGHGRKTELRMETDFSKYNAVFDR